MESNELNGFLPVWHMVMTIGMIAFIALALIIYIIYKIKVKSIRDYKARHDFIREYEIKYYRYSFYSIGVAFFMLINTYGKDTLEFEYVWFFVRLFFSIAGGTLVAYIAFLVLQYYHPTQINKKLKNLRYLPRVNPKTGNTMRLLSEDEEDVHLDEGMVAEENVFSVDYDVWIDDQTGETKIEKYQGHLEALQCNNCGFYTMRVVREEIVKMPTKTDQGELTKHYECGYCGSVRATNFKIAPDNEEYLKKQPETSMKKNTWRVIKLELVEENGERSSYEFQNVDQACQFLKESEVPRSTS